MSTYRKRIPYGMMNFVDVRKDDCYYVDKTRFIPTIEQANKFFFYIRPRRFGKSLTISMLHHYYDVLAKDMFEELYGDLYIGQHPTPERNLYLILYLNLIGVQMKEVQFLFMREKSMLQTLDSYQTQLKAMVVPLIIQVN